MDRRGLLRSALGAGLAAVTTKLWLPPVSTALAQPERTIFVPPAGGWIVDLTDGADEQVWAWGTNETGRYFRGETTYDVETFDDLPAGAFLFRPGDTVKVEFGRGPAMYAGVMVVQEIDQDFTGLTRIRGLGVESFIGSPLNPPIATIKADRGRVTRSLVDQGIRTTALM